MSSGVRPPRNLANFAVMVKSKNNGNMAAQAPRRGIPNNMVEVSMHVFAWLFIFASPLIFNHGQTTINLSDYLRGCFMPLTMFVVFYANYLVLVPRVFMRGRRKTFFIFEAMIVVAAVALIHVVFINLLFQHHLPAKCPPRRVPPEWLFALRDTITMVLVAAFGVAARLSRSWHKAEDARKEAEIGRKNAELKNLRNQINPHFLLNTLNNIYALTMIDTAKAQDAIQELARLLRHLLYDNGSQFTTIAGEVDFLNSYINLMSMRTAKSVKISAKLDSSQAPDTEIAPLLFMPIVENAFKHGINLAKESFINISLEATADGVVSFYCENSNFPKSGRELTPGGIGLQNLAQRLETIYPGRYHWQYGADEDGAVYTSHLIIRTR